MKDYFSMYDYGYTLIDTLLKKSSNCIFGDGFNEKIPHKGIPIYDTDDNEWHLIKSLVQCYGITEETIQYGKSRIQYIHLVKFDGYFKGHPIFSDELYKLEWFDSLEFLEYFRNTNTIPPIGWLTIELVSDEDSVDMKHIKDKEDVKKLVSLKAFNLTKS